MADQILILPDDSGNAGKKLDTTSLTVGANTVQRERMTVAGSAAAALAEVLNSAPSSEYGVVTRNIPSGTQNVRPSDGTNAVTSLFDADTGAGTQYVQGVSVRVPASGGSTDIDFNSGNKSAATVRVVLATDQPALTNKLLVTPDSVALPLHQSVNVDQLNGTTTDTNSGSKSAGTLRVVLATDQPQLTNKLLVTPDSVALPANQSVNVSQVAGTTLGATAVTNFGTAPAAAAVEGVNASLFSGTTGLTNTSSALDINIKSGALPTGSNVIGHVITDSGSVTNATLSAETTKVIGVTRTSDGAGNLLTANSTTPSGKFALDQNITSILGTAPTTVGKLDVKGADGDVFVRQTAAANLNATVVGTLTNNNAAPSTGNVGVLPARANAAAPSYTEGNQVALSTDLTGALRISGGGGGTQYTENTAQTTPVGTLALGQDQNSTVRALSTDPNGALTISPSSGIQDLLYQLILETRATRMAIIASSGAAVGWTDFNVSDFETQAN